MIFESYLLSTKVIWENIKNTKNVENIQNHLITFCRLATNAARWEHS